MNIVVLTMKPQARRRLDSGAIVSFADQGFLRLEGHHPNNRVSPLREKLSDELKRLNRKPGLASSLRELPVFQQIGKLSAMVKIPGLHAALVTPELIDIVTRLGGRAPTLIQDTQLLLSPPQQGAWTQERLNWHVDHPFDSRGPPAGIQAFFLLDDVAPGGGATLALAGSHRVSADTSSRLRALVKEQGNWDKELDSLGVAIVEMSGRAGDVYLMDMRLLHTPSINSSKSVRMMATCRLFLDA